MTSTLLKGGLVLALLGTPAAALAGDEVDSGGANAASGAVRASGPVRHGLAARGRNIAPGRSASGHGNFAPPSRGTLAATGERLATGQATTFSGPALTYQTSRRGPVLEIAALGAGMDKAPFLAHLGLGWKF